MEISPKQPRRFRLACCLPFIIFFGIVILVFGFVILTATEEAPDENADARKLVYGLTLNPSGFDPHFNASAELGIPLYSVYDTLVYRHPQTQGFEPGLAESWTISEDRRVYTFTLKQGVKFHDGQPFNAAAVGVNLDRIANPDFGSQKARGLLGPYYEGYALVDPYTIQIQLSQPYEPLLDGLSQVYLGIASPLALANHNDGTYQWHQVGTGPYRMKHVIPGEVLVLERNPDYTWGPPFYAKDNPNPIEIVEFRFFTDAATRDDALESGQVDMIGELLPHDSELLLGNSEVRLYPVEIPGQPLQFLFNLNRFPGSDANIRRALITATNRVAVTDIVFAGSSPVAYAPLTSVTPFYNADLESMYAYDTEEATRLFELADVTDSDENGTLDQNGVELNITILAPPWGLIPEVAQAIEGQWESLGIQVTIEQVPNFGMLLEKIDQGAWDMVAVYDFGMDASVLNSYFMTDGRNNFTGYSNPDLDQLLTLALAEPDPNTRASLYAAAQQIIMDEALILPIRDYVNLNGASSNIDGIIFSANGWWPLLNNFQWAD